MFMLGIVWMVWFGWMLLSRVCSFSMLCGKFFEVVVRLWCIVWVVNWLVLGVCFSLRLICFG